ncbi:MAG: hypothetical protein MJH10_12055 [Epibacterium sp.]|nr:hypothetical protein [Epibacterium sp.]NQX74280.1 hypothetical protein [Epibacterium sp.]
MALYDCTSTTNISVPKTPVTSFATANCTTTASTFDFDLRLTTDVPLTITSVTINTVSHSGFTSSTVIGVSTDGAVSQDYVVTASDHFGDIWTLAFTVSFASPGTPACGNITVGVVTLTAPAVEFTKEDDTIVIAGTSNAMPDGMYKLTATFYYYLNNTIFTYVQTAGLFLDNVTKCQVVSQSADLIETKCFEDAVELFMTYETAKYINECDISKACVVWDRLTNLLDGNNCGCS